MRKPTPATIIASVALFFSLGGTATAAIRHPVTVAAARQLLTRYDTQLGWPTQILGCVQHNPAVVICTVDLFAPVLTSVSPSPQTYQARFAITRSGPCATRVIRRPTASAPGIARGQGTGNCFTGPLVVVPLPGASLS